MFEILVAVAAIGGMGVIFGALLAVAAKVFEVKKDERIPKLLEVLPGANCGGCGYAGCSAYAEAMAAGTAKTNCCPSCNDDAIKKLAEILGTEAEVADKKKAFVLCSGTNSCAKKKYDYEGISDCYAASKLGGGMMECSYGCLGLGSCTKKCPFDAISVAYGVATVDSEKCTGCGACVSECPKGIIKLLPEKTKKQVMCSSKDKGKATRQACSTGCIGCGICVKNCPTDAIELKDNIAFINFEKCTNCGICVEKCPQKIIKSFEKKIPEICIAKKASK